MVNRSKILRDYQESDNFRELDLIVNFSLKANYILVSDISNNETTHTIPTNQHGAVT